MNMLNSNKDHGFSLLEMSIVLLIVSVIIVSGLLVINKYTAQSKISDTDERIGLILSAIKQFSLKYDRLPCPADPALILGDNNFGKEALAADNASCTLAGTNAYQGMVPVSTLNIFPSVANDAWGRRFKYVVRKTYVNTASGLATEVDHISLYNSQNTNPYQHVVVVVLSHGQNGYGAYSGRGGGGTTSAAGATPDEISNIQNDDGLYTFPPFNGFDDIVGFWTYDQLKNSDLME